MKYLVYVICFLPTIVLSQEIKPVEFSEVIQVDGATKQDLYNRGRSWFAEAFRDSKNVLEISDKETGELVGKGVIKYNSAIFVGNKAREGVINYTVKIQVKDGRYKYFIGDFSHEAYSTNTLPTSWGMLRYNDPPKGIGGGRSYSLKVLNEMIEDAENLANVLVKSLKENMSKPTIESDW